jgi:hypothetical protein
MLMFCPACQSAFTGLSRCPRCGGLLLMPQETPEPEDTGRAAAAPLNPTPAGRVLVGVLAGLGLYLGLRRLVGGLVLTTFDDPAGWWTATDGLTTVFGLQVTAVVFGAVLAAAGRTAGISLGAAVGGLCGGLFLGAEVGSGAPLEQLVLLLQPVVLAVGGAIAGAVGAWVWAAVPVLDMPAPAPKKLSSIELDKDPPPHVLRPTHWARIIAGAAVIIAGMGLAEKARTTTEKATGGLLKVESRGQGKFLSWQIATLAVLAGGVFAGAGTGSGLRHGFYTGMVGAGGAVGVIVSRGEMSQPAEFLLGKLNLVANNPQDPVALLGVGFGVLVAALVGGWFGGQLFLPLAPAHMRNKKFRLAND